MSLTKQEILQHAHSMVVEYCLLNGDSHTNLINAITRDIYPSKHSEAMDPFHLHIKKCSAPSHHKYNQSVHIVHFSQIKWISTLQQRPRSMLPTAHHLILFFNRIRIQDLDINFTKSIHEEFIVQCLMSVDPEDGNKWEQYLARYCAPYDFCPNYKDLLQLKGYSQSSKVYREFLTKHSWKSFTNELTKWCRNVMDALSITANDALLYRLTQALKRSKIETDSNSFHIRDKQQNEHDIMHIDEDDNDTNNSDQRHQEEPILILSDDEEDEEEEDHHGLKLMSSKDSLHEDEEQQEIEVNHAMDIDHEHDAIADDPLNLEPVKLPQSMPLLEIGSQSIQMDDIQAVESTQEDEDEPQPLTQNRKCAHDSNESPDLCASQTSQTNADASQQSETSTSELLQSQNNVDVFGQSQYPVLSQPQCTGFGAFGDTHHSLDRSELLPQDQDVSETESPPDQNSLFQASPLADVDYLSQNKASHVQNHNERGTKRTYNELERLSDEAPLTQNVKRARIDVENEDAKQEKKIKCMKDNQWEAWMKKGAEITVELEDDLLLSIVRKVSAKFVLIKITDDDAPKKYIQKQLKIYLKDKNKLEPVMEMNETQTQSDEEQIPSPETHETTHAMNDIEESQDSITPPELTQNIQNNNNHNHNNRNNKEENDNEEHEELKSLLRYRNKEKTQNNNHIRWNLTLSQEQKVSDKERKTSAYEHDDDEYEEEEEDVGQSSVFNMFKASTFSSDSMPQQLINREFITDPDKACGLKQNRNNKFKIYGSKKRKRIQRNPWTDIEIDCLIKGVEKYKKYENAPRGKQGMWAYIMKDPKFGNILIKNQRENSHLCDKWRHLVAKKDPRVRHLVDESSKKKLPKLPTRAVR